MKDATPIEVDESRITKSLCEYTSAEGVDCHQPAAYTLAAGWCVCAQHAEATDLILVPTRWGR